MARDRHNQPLRVGDKVKTTPSMGLIPNISSHGTIKAIDGEYIFVYITSHRVEVERYGCELEKVL